jgi:hypothetical protein
MRQLGGGVSMQVETVDLSFCIGDRGLRIRPCETDFQRRKQYAVNDDGLAIHAPDPGVP